MEQHDIVVVGGGPAGMAAAVAAYDAGVTDVVILDREEDIGGILERGDRTAAGPTVPPGGLYMTRLWYDDGVDKFEVCAE